jgi:hypothetical protein
MVGYLCHEQTSEEHHYPVQAAEPVSLEVEKVICMKGGGVAAGDGRPMHITSSSVCATWSFAWVRRMMGAWKALRCVIIELQKSIFSKLVMWGCVIIKLPKSFYQQSRHMDILEYNNNGVSMTGGGSWIMDPWIMDYNNCGCVKGICFQLAFFFQLAYQILLHFTVNLGNKMKLDSRVVGKAVELCMWLSLSRWAGA